MKLADLYGSKVVKVNLLLKLAGLGSPNHITKILPGLPNTVNHFRSHLYHIVLMRLRYESYAVTKFWLIAV